MKIIPTLPPSLLFVNDTILHMVEQCRYMLLYLDTTWCAYINTIHLQARRLIGMLYHKSYSRTFTVMQSLLTLSSGATPGARSFPPQEGY